MSQEKDLPPIDLTQSVLGSVFQTFKTDKKKAEAVLDGFRQEMQTERTKVEQFCLQTFYDLPKETILECVHKNLWDTEKSLLELTHIRSLVVEEKVVHDNEIKVEVTECVVENTETGPVIPPREDFIQVTHPEQPNSIDLLAAGIIVPQYVEISSLISLDVSSLAATEKSWVGMFLSNEKKSYLTYQYLSTAKNGILSFYSPNLICDIVFQFFQIGENEIGFSTKSIHVGADVQIVAVVKGEHIHGAISQLFGNPLSGGWIGLYPTNQTNAGKYLAYQKLDDLKDGTFMFDVPINPQDYNVRLFSTSLLSSYNFVGKSGDVTIQGSDSCFITRDGDFILAKPTCLTYDPAVNKVWIGLYKVDENATKNYLDYAILKDRYSEVKIPVPKIEGKYQLRLLRKYRTLATSNTITITIDQAEQVNL
jgi:hypothetical protein